MGFYNSGIKRLFKGNALQNQRNSVEIEKLKKNETADDSTATSHKALIDANTAKVTFPGFGSTSTTALRGNTTTISGSQSSAITANTAYRIQVYEIVGTNAQWNALTGITTTTGYAITGEGAPDLRTDTILSIRLETWAPEAVGKTPTAISNVQWRFNPYDSFGTAVTDNIMFNVPFYGGNIANTAGVHICQPSPHSSYSKSSSTECNMVITEEPVRLAVNLSGALDTEEIPNKIRCVIVFVANAGSGYAY